MLKIELKRLKEIDWKLFVKLVYQKAKEIEITVRAMSLVYTTLLSIIPLLIFSFYIMTLFNFFGGMDNIVTGMKEFILSHLATGTGQTLIDLLDSYINDIDVAQLGVISLLSLVAVIIYLLTRVEKSFNLIWQVKEHRDFFKRFVAFWTFITLGTLFITVSLSLTISFITAYISDSMINLSVSDAGMLRFISTLSYFLLYIMAYYLIPNTDVEPLAAIIGGSISGFSFTLARILYTIYTRNIVTYYRIRRIYGSLSVLPLFLIWLYVVWMITLFGAVITYVFHHRNNLHAIRKGRVVKDEVYEFLPLAILTILYKDFSGEDFKGLTLTEIAQRINLPIEIIERNLALMKAEGLIAETDNNRFIPLKASDKLFLWPICDQLILADEQELEEIFVDGEIKEIYQYFSQGLYSQLSDLTMEDIITNKG